VCSLEATDAVKLTKIRSAVVILRNTPRSPSLMFTEYALLRKMISSQRTFEI
jgi:hypothetical protein